MTAAPPNVRPWSGWLCLSEDQRLVLDATFEAFAHASDEVVQVGLGAGTASNTRLHALCYRSLRQRYGLSANLAVRAVAHGAARLRRRGGGEAMVPDTVTLDGRVLSFDREGRSVSLSTVRGRLQGLPVRQSEGPECGGVVVRASLHREAEGYRLLADLAERPARDARPLGLVVLLAVLFAAPAFAQDTPRSGDGVYVPPSEESSDPYAPPLYAQPAYPGYPPPGNPPLGALGVPGKPVVDIDYATLPPAALRTVEALSVDGADLAGTLRALASEYGLSLVVDPNVYGPVTANLADVRVVDALVSLARQGGLSVSQSGDVFSVSVPPPAPVEPRPVRVSSDASGLSVDVDGVPVTAFAQAVAEAAGVSVVVRQGVEGLVSGSLRAAPFESGLRAVLGGGGFSLTQSGGVWLIDRPSLDAVPGAPGGFSAGFGASTDVQVDENGLVSFDLTDASIADVVRQIAAQAGLELAVYQVPEGTVTARASGLSVDEALSLILRRSNVTFRRERGVYVVGLPDVGAVESRLIRLGHLRAEAALDMVPEVLRDGAVVQLVAEQNGVVVTGHIAAIAAVQRFLDSVDLPSPLILIEALVVDFDDTDLFELGVSVGRGVGDAERARRIRPTFGGETGYDDGIRVGADGARLNDAVRRVADVFGVGPIGRLPDDFYLRLRALERDGRARVRSRPQISTLNGHTASISVGTTQYYILKSSTPYSTPVGDPNDLYPLQSERFEKIEANVRLEITPYVTASGEVTAEIKPEFSTPVGQLDPAIPPTINTRVLESTVRLRDGETIILGGLIQDGTSRTYNKVPILGSIPLLGRLFRSESSVSRKTELVIYLTPHIFYGDERDAARWTEVRERLGLSGEEVGAPRPPRPGY